MKLNPLSAMCSFIHIQVLLDPLHGLVDQGRVSVKDPWIALFPKVPPCVDDKAVESSLAFFGDKTYVVIPPIVNGDEVLCVLSHIDYLNVFP